LYICNVVCEYSKLAILNYNVVFRRNFWPHTNVWKSNFLVVMEVLNVCVNFDAFGDQKMYAWQLSKPLKMNGIQISLLNVACLNSMQNVGARKCGKMITHCFWFKFVFLNKEIQHRCHCFQLWFWKWNVLFNSIMYTWERMCLKKIWVEFWCFIEVFFNILVDGFLKFLPLFFKAIAFPNFHIVPFPCCRCFWIFNACCFELWCNF
jgi:hypothetical protein